MRFRFWYAAVVLVLAGCSSGQLNLEKLDAEGLFDRGTRALAAHKWDDAITVFDRLTLQYPSFPRLQEARFDLAQAYYGKKEYVTAAGEFDRLANDFPLGPWADHARFMVCRSYAALSPKVALDQQYTQSAIDHCTSLLSYYPNSTYAPQARTIIDTMKEKLAQKALLAGNFYFRRHAFDSALIYFEDVVKNYPKTTAASEALLREVQSYQALGYKEDAQAAKERLMKEYPGSAAAKTVTTISLARS